MVQRPAPRRDSRTGASDYLTAPPGDSDTTALAASPCLPRPRRDDRPWSVFVLSMLTDVAHARPCDPPDGPVAVCSRQTV